MKRINIMILAALCCTCAAQAQTQEETPAQKWPITLEEGAFKNSQLETLGYQLTGVIKTEAFAGCDNLKEVDLTGVTVYRPNFSYDSTTGSYVPEAVYVGVDSIGAKAFASCKSLERVTVTALPKAEGMLLQGELPCTLTPAHTSAFQGNDMTDKQLCVVSSIPGAGSAYREADGWKYFGDVYAQYFMLLVNMWDGSSVGPVHYDDHPALTFDDQYHVYYTDCNQQLEWDLRNMKSLQTYLVTDHLVGTPVEAVKADVPVFSLHQGRVEVQGVEGDVQVVSLDGKLVRTACAANGQACIDMNTLPMGVYVVNAGKHGIKVINK